MLNSATPFSFPPQPLFLSLHTETILLSGLFFLTAACYFSSLYTYGMASANGSANVRNPMQSGKNPPLPPRSPFWNTSSVHSDYSIDPPVRSKVIPKPKDLYACHQRTSSESLLMDEQPSWLDDLLDEPDTPVRKGHRRSSSDSFAYVDVSALSNMDYISSLHDQRTFKNMDLPQLQKSQYAEHFKVNRSGSLYSDLDSYEKAMDRTWEWPLVSAKHSRSPFLRDKYAPPLNRGSSTATKGADPVTSTVAEKWDQCEYGLPDSMPLLEKNVPHAKLLSENDSTRAKQQYAHRSRVRKLQYISELERNVQTLQAEGSEVSAEMEFLNQQSLILSMENKALKQRLQSVSQEQLIKHLEHEMLEREVGRLRALQQQNQQQRQSSIVLRRSNSKDVESQLASLSLRNKDGSSGGDVVYI